jgi:isocitrate/isopropylmalate dehydrogenase
MFNWLGETRKDEQCLRASEQIEKAVISTLQDRIVTPDLGGTHKTREVGEAVAERILPERR